MMPSLKLREDLEMGDKYYLPELTADFVYREVDCEAIKKAFHSESPVSLCIERNSGGVVFKGRATFMASYIGHDPKIFRSLGFINLEREA